MKAEKYNINSDPSLGYYPKPGWEWQKPAPKTYLIEHGLAKYAHSWILNLVELVHWLLFVPAFILSFIIFQHSSTLNSLLGSDIQVFLLLLSPLIQSFGGLLGIIMHEYEGWQVVFFQNPLDSNFKIENCNNEWLREVTYKLLIFMQGVGLLAFSLGVFGINKITLTFAIVSSAIAFFAPQNPKVTFDFNKQPVFPISIPIFAFIIVNAIINFVAYFHLFNAGLTEAHLSVLLSGVVPILFAIGGVVEAIIAESTFNQWWHFIAVVFLNIGMFSQIYLFSVLW